MNIMPCGSKYKTAQELWAAILKIFGGNEATKKTKKNLLKQQYGNFKAEGSETLEQTFNRLQKKSEPNSQNIAFISLAKHSKGNEEVNTASVSTASTNVPTASANIGVASISQDTACPYRRGRKLHALMANTSAESKVFDNSLCSKDCKKNTDSLNSKITDLTNKLFDAKNMIYHYKLRLVPVESRLAEHRDQEIKYYLDSLLESQRLDKNKEGLRYNVVPPPPAQIYSPPKKDMSWTGLPKFKDDIVTNYSRPAPTVESSPDDAQNRNPFVTETKALPSTISPKSFIKFVKANNSPTNSKTDKAETTKKPPIKYAEQYKKPTKKPNVRGNQRNWNNLKSHQLGPNFVMKKNACFNCGDFNHLAYDCSKRVKKGTSRSHNTTRKSFTPRPAVHKPYRPPMRPMRSNMNGARPNKTSFNKPEHSYTNRPFQRTSAVRSQYNAPWVPTVNKNFPPVNRKFSTVSRNFSTVNRKFPTANRKFPTGGTKFSAAVIGKKGKAIKPSACWFWKPSQNLSNKGLNSNSGSSQNNIDDKGYWDSGCSRHMTGQNFKLSDDDNVLLRTPRQHNMYSIDLNNIVPHKDLTCLVAKASADEYILWHKRLG
nr:ribonuclease H-like domain-containing protein [Tanacetum cinerariifolium]